MVDSVVLGVCMTPLGSPVVPDVNTTSWTRVRVAARQRPAARLRFPRRIRERGERLHAVGRLPARHEDALEPRQAAADLRRHLAVVEAAEGRGNDQRLRFEEPQHEAQLAGAIGRRDRVDDGAQAARGQEDQRELVPVRQLAGDDAARLEPVGAEPVGHALDGARQRGPRVAPLPVHEGGLVGPGGRPPVEVGLEALVPPEPRRRTLPRPRLRDSSSPMGSRRDRVARSGRFRRGRFPPRPC